MSDSLVAIAALGALVGGAIVLIDSVILRRIRRQDARGQTASKDEERR
jgi:hypothetical protein